MRMTTSNWPYVPLGEVLTQVWDSVAIIDNAPYKQVTVRMHNKGLVLRQEVLGREIKTKQQYRIHSGQFVYSRIDARNGAMGLVPPELDGAIVSNDFPVLDVQTDRLDPRFLTHFVSTRPFLDACLSASAGTTNRRRLKEASFLRILIPLPLLDEQQHIVARIEALAMRVKDAFKLQAQAIQTTRALLASAKSSVFAQAKTAGWVPKPLEQVAPANMGQSPRGNSYNNAGVGVPLLNGPTEFGKRHPAEIQWTTAPTKLCGPGDILICVRGATTGRMNWADKKYCIGRGLAALTVDSAACLPEYVYHFVATQTQQMLELATGTTFPNLSGEKLRGLEIPVPPLAEQQHIVTYLDSIQVRLETMQHEQESSQAALAAMLPSVLDKAFRGEL